ncbi:hypothetical protein D3C73_1477340 [compost metagenome]
MLFDDKLITSCRQQAVVAKAACGGNGWTCTYRQRQTELESLRNDKLKLTGCRENGTVRLTGENNACFGRKSEVAFRARDCPWMGKQL